MYWEMKKFESITYTIKHQRTGDHLQVTIVESGITVETQPGKTSDSDAFDVAHAAIERALLDVDAFPQSTILV